MPGLNRIFDPQVQLGSVKDGQIVTDSKWGNPFFLPPGAEAPAAPRVVGFGAANPTTRNGDVRVFQLGFDLGGPLDLKPGALESDADRVRLLMARLAPHRRIRRTSYGKVGWTEQALRPGR